MQKAYAIQEGNGAATFRANVNALRNELGKNSNWTPKVLEMAKYNKLFTGLASFYGGMHSKLEEQTESSFVVRGVAGKGFVLYYLVRGIDANSSQIEPIARVDSGTKASITIRLLIMCIFPVVFAPVLIKNKANQARKFSADLLPVFCEYLQARLYGAPSPPDVQNRPQTR